MAKYERIPGGEKNDLTGQPFNKKELEKICELYIEIDGKGIHENNPKIHILANELNRTVRSVENQLLGFRAYVTNKSGRKNYNSLIPEIWEEKNSEIKISPEKNRIIKERELFDEFKFRISSQLKTILGKNLITDDFVAVFELVKNSFDAHAKKVKIIFDQDKITIWDDGKGMNRRDIIDKWLFIAYSAKNEGIEDVEFEEDKNKSYRDRINPNRSYAGQKGIGRMGSDRLGSTLEMTTKKINDSIYWNLKFDWDEYENDALDEFGDIEIKYSNANSTKFKNFENGLILEISNLRNVWPRKKILDLKKSLAKLINPFTLQNEFSIEFISQRELKKDLESANSIDIVNGEVKNFVFEALNIATTQIKVSIMEDEDFIETTLIDRGNLIYKIKEPNKYKHIPSKSNILLFYLNTHAKSSFTKTMGITSAEFGSIFLFNNGFRVLPFGEPNNDPFNINERKAQGYARFLGTRELIGQVSISENTEQFQETSSRDGGLLNSPGTEELRDFFIESLKKLESFVAPILWKISKRVGDNQETLDLTAKNQVLDFVKNIAGKKNIQLIEYSDELINYITENVEEQNLPQFDTLREIAIRANDKKGLLIIDNQESDYKKEIKRRKEAEKKAIDEENRRKEAEKKAIDEENKRKEAENSLKEKESQNLFLKSVKSQELDEIVSFMHSIGISADILNNYISGLHKRINRREKIPNEVIGNKLRQMSLENRKILAISQFATKANFKLYAEEVEGDILEFIHEYLKNIVIPIRSEDIEIISNNLNSNQNSFICTFKPIEITIIIDNLVSNSIRAKSTRMTVDYEITKENLNVNFRDDGIGIPEESVKNIFDLGFTTTSGSGLGLFHVNSIIESSENMNITVNNKIKKGVELILTFKK
ncbi:ATP-binding protein [Flavobacterium soyae]|uniref:ATP-binding protein n=1 Tax=Flavobacterium soyae TaxID=2903098 RepID=A0ABZ2UJ17_9FLAO